MEFFIRKILKQQILKMWDGFEHKISNKQNVVHNFAICFKFLVKYAKCGVILNVKNQIAKMWSTCHDTIKPRKKYRQYFSPSHSSYPQVSISFPKIANPTHVYFIYVLLKI